jgi:NADPH:quinone reductase-like Zn-dependent oxidoreductase
LVALSPFVSQLPRLRTSKQAEDRSAVLKELIEAGRITPVIDRTYPLSEVPEAIRYLEEGRAQGKVVITV